MMSRMHERYRKEVVPALMKRFGRTNPMSVPKVAKVTVNIGMGEASQNVKLLDVAVIELGQIAGQKPIVTRGAPTQPPGRGPVVRRGDSARNR